MKSYSNATITKEEARQIAFEEARARGVLVNDVIDAKQSKDIKSLKTWLGLSFIVNLAFTTFLFLSK